MRPTARKRWLFSVLTAAVLLAPPAAAQDVEWAWDAFDWMSPGALAGRNGWETRDGRTAFVVGRQPQCNALLVDAEPGMRIGMQKAVPAQTRGTHELRFRVMLSEPASSSLAQLELLTAPGGAPKLRFLVGSGLQVSGGAGPAQALVESLAVGRWYSVRAALDLGASTAAFIVDGKPLAARVTMVAGPVGAIGLSGFDAPGGVYLADLSGRPLEALPALEPPNHPLTFGYFYADSRWGDFTSETSTFTNLELVDVASFPGIDGGPAVWRPALHEALWRAQRAGRPVRLGLGQERCRWALDDACPYPLGEVLATAAPFWDFVHSLTIADEPPWSRAILEGSLADLRAELAGRGLRAPPIGVVLSREQLADQLAQAAGLDWVGLEAYVDPPGSGYAALDVYELRRVVFEAMGYVPRSRSIVLVMQGYDRNAAWQDRATLAALQLPVYEIARGDPRVVGIDVFSFGRCGGTHAYPGLQARHERIGAAIASVNRPPSVQLLTPSAGAVLPLAPVTLAAAAEDVDGAVARVDFYAGTERVGSATAAPWSFRWTPPAPGFYAILAVAIDDDGASAASETRVVTVGNPSPPRLTVGAAAAREGPSAALEFPVRLSAAVPWPVTLRYSTAAGTAREGADYSGGSATLRIPPGLTSAAVRVAVVDDLLDEDDETLRLLPGEIDGAALATAEAVGTIVDDDAPPALELVDARVPEGDRGAALTLPLRLSAPSGRDVVVRYATFDLTASAGSDYAASAGTLTIRAGETRASLAVAIAGDRVFEPDEQLGVRISGSGFVSPRSEAFVTIQNDDAPGLSIGDVRMREPATGSQPAVFTVSLAPPLERAVTVSFATRDGSAHAGSDYVAATGVLTFAPGVATLTVPVTVNADSQREPVEAFAVALRDASGAPIAWPEGDARIVDSRTRGDLDGDGRADILWRRTGGIAKERAEAYLWAMDGTGLAAAHALDSISGEWQVLFTDDFDGDGKTDVLWRNYGAGPDAGKLYVWMMDGPDVVGGTGYTAAQADLGWRVDGVGDLNGDGKADIVWRKTGAGADKGAAFLWLMNGTGLAGARYLDAIGGDWQVVDLGDFNGDGKSDVLWRNFGTGGDAGKLYVWMMDGPNVVGGTGYTAAQADLAWRIDGVGDLDGDGKDDIVWRKTGAGVDKGALFLWTMDGTGLSGARYLDPISEAWQIHGLGDFNGDGMADILWRNQGGGAEAGNVYIWMMDGGSVAAGTGYTAAQADLGWRIDSPRR